MSEKFSLRWNDYHSNWSKSLIELRKDTDLADVTLVTDDKVKISAHKILLSSCTNIFKFRLRKVKEELDKVVEEITIKVAERNRNKIMDNFKHLDQSEGETFANGIWKIKKKIMPKNKTSLPAAKVDVNGKLVTEPKALKKLYLETFQHRLRSRPSKKDYVEIEQLQETLLPTLP